MNDFGEVFGSLQLFLFVSGHVKAQISMEYNSVFVCFPP